MIDRTRSKKDSQELHRRTSLSYSAANNNMEGDALAKSKKELAVARLIRESANDDPPLTVEEAIAMVEARERTKELDAIAKRAKKLMKKAEDGTLTENEQAEYDRLMKGGMDDLVIQYGAIADEFIRSREKR